MAAALHLDGVRIRSECDFHDAVAAWSGFAGYGRNLDALWDVLVGIVEPPIDIRWIGSAASRAAMGDRFDRIVDVLREAQGELGPNDFSLEIR